MLELKKILDDIMILINRFLLLKSLYIEHIVRPVKRDWAVLSKDTPVDISILKSVRQSVFIHL